MKQSFNEWDVIRLYGLSEPKGVGGASLARHRGGKCAFLPSPAYFLLHADAGDEDADGENEIGQGIGEWLKMKR